MKIQNKLKLVSILSVLLILVSTTCFAATSNKDVKMEIVENNVCTIKINDYTNFEKKITDYDLEKKEITIGLKVTNTAEPVFDKPTEIFLVIDNSLSMRDDVTATENRLKVVTDSAKKFATELLKNENVKIGIVKFSTGENEGSITDATLLTTPTANSETVMNSISSIANGELGPRTNIDAGITLASQNFSAACECKYIILLTDGVPNTAIDGPILTYSGEVETKTKAKLLSLENAGAKIFAMMTGVQNVEEPTTGYTYKELAERVFGTSEEPTVGKFYYIPDTQIEKTVCETILEDMAPGNDSTLTNLKIYDYFPQEIVDNFNFSYVSRPTKGTISEDIDLQNNMIVWSIDKLEPGESATVSYKLTLKENVNDNVINKILNTNTKVDITADELENVISSDVSPKIRLIKNTPNVAPTPIPQTGTTSTIYILAFVFVTLAIVFGTKIFIINRK